MRIRRLMPLGLVALLLMSTQGLTQYRDRGSRGGSSSSSTRDPDSFFRSLAGGKDTMVRTEMNPAMHWMFDRVAEKLNITSGQITKEQFSNYMNQMKSEGKGPPSSAPQPAAVPSPSSGSPPSSYSPWGDRSRGWGNSSWGSPESMAVWADESFRRYDHDGDGVLSFEEMPDDLKASLDTWDANGNGAIDIDEYRAYYTARMQQKMMERSEAGIPSPWESMGREAPMSSSSSRGVDKKPLVYHTSNLPKELPSWFRERDGNKDAQVSLYEWRMAGGSLEEFQRMDRNNDGLLTVEEVLRYKGLGASNGSTQLARSDENSSNSERGSFGPRGGDRGSFGPPPGSDRGSSGRGSFGPRGGDRGSFGPPPGSDRGSSGDRGSNGDRSPGGDRGSRGGRPGGSRGPGR